MSQHYVTDDLAPQPSAAQRVPGGRTRFPGVQLQGELPACLVMRYLIGLVLRALALSSIDEMLISHTRGPLLKVVNC
jgi:hypothetical protein